MVDEVETALEGEPVCTGCAVTERFALMMKYFYDENNLEEYADMPLHEKAVENKLLVGGAWSRYYCSSSACSSWDSVLLFERHIFGFVREADGQIVCPVEVSLKWPIQRVHSRF